jgi:hypothetical protein
VGLNLYYLFTEILLAFDDIPPDDSRLNLALAPVHGFGWLVYVSLLALHTILAVIITELMSRTYGKWWLWLAVAFLFPIIGPIAIYLYHTIVSTSVSDARKRTFWERTLLNGPVSLSRILLKEKAKAQEVILLEPMPRTGGPECSVHDTEIDALLDQGKFTQARGLAWKMMEIAREAKHQNQIAKYQEYLEVIAERESVESGVDLYNR